MKSTENNFTQELILPSQGLLNPEIPEGKVTQRCMMVADQKFLSGASQSAGNALQSLIQRTVTSPEGFSVEDLSLPDTLYLLFKLRILSYGKDYKFRTKCPECGKKIDILVDLSEIPVETLSGDYEENLCVVLPHRGDTVYTKILTNRDFDEINKELKRRKKRNPNDDSSYVLNIVYAIKSIKLVNANQDGKTELTHPIDIEKYINSLTDLDASSIIAARDTISFGTASTIDVLCPECKEEIEVGVSFSGDFFRPTPSR